MSDDPIKSYVSRLVRHAIMSAAVYGVDSGEELEYVVTQVAAQILEDSLVTARLYSDVNVISTTVRALRESVHRGGNTP